MRWAKANAKIAALENTVQRMVHNLKPFVLHVPRASINRYFGAQIAPLVQLVCMLVKWLWPIVWVVQKDCLQTKVKVSLVLNVHVVVIW